jgi:hypothetical protein
MTEPQATPAQRVAPEPAGSDPVGAAWTEYLAAARQLDGVRRGAATAAGEQARSVRAAREELGTVRARLARQQNRLRERGVPAMSLVPSPPEVAAAARSMGSGPAAVLAGLRTAGECTDTAEALLDARRAFRPVGWLAGRWRSRGPTGTQERADPVPLRNLLGYGLFALLVPVLQLVVLGLVRPGGGGVLAALLGLPLAGLAFGAGWLLVGRLPGSGTDGRPDRTPWWGALVCGVPTAVVTAGILLAVLL